ncbi:DUF6087 family protein [Streptomyces sp. 24-1644]|uniref:DUF6087 family protein n=1 Tax=Streptomyces sp. 24-1644 TaxID=3457315 RepID=UPI003FA6EF59
MSEREEPLEQWAARRAQRRASDRQITGRRRAEPLDPAAARGRASHLAPDAPRVLLELDVESGEWVPVGVADNAAEAAFFLTG